MQSSNRAFEQVEQPTALHDAGRVGSKFGSVRRVLRILDLVSRHEGLQKGQAIEKYSDLIHLGRVSVPEDVASYVSYLASADSDYMTGQSVMIDGGIQFS